mgnify:CR=1 FL=1
MKAVSECRGLGNSFMTALISAATDQARQITGRAFVTETWGLTLDAWPGCRADAWWDGMREGTVGMLEAETILIRKAPFLAVSSVKTVAEDGTLTTWSSSNYFTTAENGFGRLTKVNGATWPDMSPPVRQRGGILITFTAGYGADPQSVPAAVRHAIKLIAAHMYENRESNDPPQQALTLLNDPTFVEAARAIVARVATVQNTSANAKACVMIRESLADNSIQSMCSVANGSVSFVRRTATGGPLRPSLIILRHPCRAQGRAAACAVAAPLHLYSNSRSCGRCLPAPPR